MPRAIDQKLKIVKNKRFIFMQNPPEILGIINFCYSNSKHGCWISQTGQSAIFMGPQGETGFFSSRVVVRVVNIDYI